MAVKAKIHPRCEGMGGGFCQGKDSRQDAKEWMAVMEKIQNKRMAHSLKGRIQEKM